MFSSLELPYVTYLQRLPNKFSFKNFQNFRPLLQNSNAVSKILATHPTLGRRVVKRIFHKEKRSMRERREKQSMTVHKNRIDPSPGVGFSGGDLREATRHGRRFRGTWEGVHALGGGT